MHIEAGVDRTTHVWPKAMAYFSSVADTPRTSFVTESIPSPCDRRQAPASARSGEMRRAAATCSESARPLTRPLGTLSGNLSEAHYRAN